MVSIYPGPSLHIEGSNGKPTLTIKEFTQFLRKNRDLLGRPDHFLGVWHDPKTGDIWLDVSVHTKTPARAERLAKKYNQVAYYNLDTGKSVETGGTGAPIHQQNRLQHRG